jgi:glyoxylase-like metal-dependent hydrolase (beta-lactamase superfamily II)
LRGERNILVDTGSPLDLPLLTGQLKKHGLGLGDIALIVLTHVHFDHAGTVAAIQKISGCAVAVHHLEKDCLEKGQNAPIIPIQRLGSILMPFMGVNFQPARATIVIENEFDLSGYGVDARIFFTPGHTPGSISLLTGDGQAIVGDLFGGGLLFGQFQPEAPRYHYWASSLADLSVSIKTLLSCQPSQIHVGHGGPLEGLRAKEFFNKGYIESAGYIRSSLSK